MCFSLSFPFGFLCNWMSMFLPLVATLLAARLLCQSRVTSRGAGPLHVVSTCGRRCSSGGLWWLTVLILCVVPGANARSRANGALTDMHSRGKRGDAERVKGHFWWREMLEREIQASMDWIREDSVGKCSRGRRWSYSLSRLGVILPIRHTNTVLTMLSSGICKH